MKSKMYVEFEENAFIFKDKSSRLIIYFSLYLSRKISLLGMVGGAKISYLGQIFSPVLLTNFYGPFFSFHLHFLF